MAEAKNIGLFGGTFNPVHNGHVSIADAFLNSGFIDKLLILPTPFPPHKSGAEFAAYSTRVKMLQAVFDEKNVIQVDKAESLLPKPNYSINTVRYLKEKHPKATFFYCLGEDSLVNFKSWKNYSELLNECELLAAKRPGYDFSNVPAEVIEKTHFVDHTPVNISSTRIREMIAEGRNVSALVPRKALDIILKEGLYKEL